MIQQISREEMSNPAMLPKPTFSTESIWSKTRGRAIKTPFSCYRKIHYKKSRFRVCQRMAASISVTWDELHRSYFEEGKQEKHQKCEERKRALVLDTDSCLPATCFPLVCRTIVLNTKRKNTKKKTQILAGGFSCCGFYRDVSDPRLFQ